MASSAASLGANARRALRGRTRMFASDTPERRVHRAGDIVLVGFGVLLVVVNGWWADRTGPFETAINDAVQTLPSWAFDLFSVAFALGAIYALALLLASVLRKEPRWDVARDLVVAAAVAIAVGLIAVRLIDGEWPIVFPELGRAEAAARFPVMRVAVVTAVVAVSGPHVLRPLRTFGWTVVFMVAISGLGIGLGLPTDALGGVGLGIAAAGAVLAVFGSPAGYPNSQRILSDLSVLGLDIGELTPAPQQTWGARTMLGEDADGRPVLVKVYGSDARDAQFFSKLWRFFLYRDAGSSVTFSRLQQVEHEALVMLLAGRAGVSVPAVLVAAISDDEDAVLVTEARGGLLIDVDPAEISDEMLEALWAEVARLHGESISHGALNTSHVEFDGGNPVLASFQSGSLSASPARLATDIAELLVSLSAHVGVGRAVGSAATSLGNEALESAVPYLQVPALTTMTRKAVSKVKALVKQVQEEVVGVTGIEAPEPAEIRRVTVRDLVFSSLMVFAAYFLIKQLVGLDLASIWASLKSAEMAWVAAGFFAAQLILIPNATGMMAAVSAPIPLRPTVILQSAIQFIGLAIPSSAARIATNVAFLRKYGVSAVTALTQGATDSFSGFLVQTAILLSALWFGNASFGLSGKFDLNWWRIFWFALAILAIGAGIVWFVKSLRDKILSAFGEVVRSVGELLHAPRRAIALLSSNLGSQLALAASMWLMVRAYGESLSLPTVLVIVVAAVMLSGLAPTPGGVGVAEAALAAGLVAAGIDQNTAFSIAIVYRLVTFFLPPIWGFFSLRWLEKSGFL